MRIWMLVSEWPGKNSGGIARYAHNYARLLGKKGHEVTVITCDRPEGLSKIAPGVQITGIIDENNPGPSFSGSKLNKVLSRPAVLSYRMSQTAEYLAATLPKPDLVEVQDYNAVAYFLMQNRLLGRSALGQTPFLVHLHSPDFRLRKINREDRYRLPFYWVGRMEKFCLLAADALLSPSQFLKEDLNRHLSLPREPAVIPYPLAWEKDFKIESNPGIDATVLYPGRLELRKGVLELVNACDALWSKGVDFTLKCIGGDTGYVPEQTTVGKFLKTRYRNRIKSGNLVLESEKSHTTILEEMKKAAVVVIPSLWENFPHTCMEAMSLGKVVVATESGGQAEMISEPGRDGFLFNWEKKADFEQKLSSALNLAAQDRLNMGRAAHQRISTFCQPDRIAGQRVAHMRKVIENFQPRTSMPVVYMLEKQFPKNFDLGQAGHEFSARLKPGLITAVVESAVQGRHFGKTVDSIQSSDYKAVEILDIEDDGEEAWSRKIRQARGEYILLLEAGVCLEPSFLSEAIAVLGKLPNVTFVYSWYKTGRGSGKIVPAWNIDLPYFHAGEMTGPAVLARTAEILDLLTRTPKKRFPNKRALFKSLIEAGGIGVSIPETLARLGGKRTTSDTGYQDDIDPELAKLLKANGPGNTWIDPSLDSLWFREKRRKEKRSAKSSFLRGRLSWGGNK